jgi:uncharacterized protein (DUF58 family)
VIRQRWQAWWQSRLPRSDTLQLGQRNIYILPTRAGLMFAATVLVLLIASINFQLNLGYALTFLLAGSALASMHQTHKNLRGLHLQLRPPSDTTQGEATPLEILLSQGSEGRGVRARYGIGLRLMSAGEQTRVWADLADSGPSLTRLQCLQPHRGVHALEALHIETRFPMGLFRAWAIWRPASTVWVYPRPEPDPPPIAANQGPHEGAATRPSRREDVGDLSGVRPYRAGDPPQRLAWKKAAAAMAAGTELVTRCTEGLESAELWLDEADCAGLPLEQRLSRLAAWALVLHRGDTQRPADARFGLRLNRGVTLPPGDGPAHLQAVMRSLAEVSA